MHISFVILHYLTIDDTVECIESILNNVKYKDYTIIVVDNGSPNGTGESLRLKYSTNKKVKIIISKVNLGFANGNNLGFVKAKNDFNSDFIVLLNNDTIIKQEDFVYKFINKYKELNYGVAGPNIISTVDFNSQNPQPYRIKTKRDAWKHLLKHIILYLINITYLENIKNMILKKFKPRKLNSVCSQVEQMNVQLHGSCLIFSPIYINMFNGLYSKTFMYYEEDILFHLCNKNGLKTIYLSDLTIYHKEDSATNEYLNNDLKKNRFIYRHSISSIYQLIRLMS